MKCNQTALIHKQLSGELTNAERAVLQEHLKQCPACRRELEELGEVGEILNEAFCDATSAEIAAARIIAKLPEHDRRPMFAINIWSFKWALAASMFLTFALAIGFAAGRMSTTVGRPHQQPLEIKIAKLEGTVLVRHPDQTQWSELASSSKLCMGDLLLCSAKSSLALTLRDGSSLVLEPNSIFHLNHYDGGAEFVLDRGNLLADLNSPHPPFVIRTPQGIITALGTKFRVSIK